MNANLYIKENNRIKLSLIAGKKEVDSLAWEDKNNLSRSLLTNLDKLLQKSGIGVDKISGYKIISDVPKNWTSVGIAEITFKSLEIAELAK